MQQKQIICTENQAITRFNAKSVYFMILHCVAQKLQNVAQNVAQKYLFQLKNAYICNGKPKNTIMAVIYKSLSAKVDANGNAQVLFLVKDGRKGRVRTKSGVFVPVQYWNEKKQNISIPQKVGAVIKADLQNIKDCLDIAEKRTLKLVDIFGIETDKHFIEATLSSLKAYQGTITEDVVNNILQNEAIKEREAEEKQNIIEKNAFSHCEAFIAKGYSVTKVRMWHVVFRSMSRYEVFRNKIAERPFTWNIDCVTREDIEDLFDFFANEHIYRTKYAKIFNKAQIAYPEQNKCNHKKPAIEERGENRLVDMRKNVKTFWNWLIKTKRTKNNPFDGVEIGTQKYGTPYYLTIEERNAIAEYDFSGKPYLEVQRDIFIFQCLIGCRVGDLAKFTPDNIVNGILVYTPHKTKDDDNSFVARVPLNARALGLVAKYAGKDKHGRLFPFIADQGYNDAIKAILVECGVDRMVNVRNAKTGENEMKPICEIGSSHMARRTFVGNAYKVVKDPNLIGRMSGHVEGSKAFVRYRDIDDEMLKEVINAIQ